MKKIIALTGLAMALSLAPAPAGAQELPGWPTGAACDRADNWCPQYEARTRVQVSGIWPTLPPDIRQKCVADTATVEKSYRLLYDCLANSMQDYIKNQTRAAGSGDAVQLTPAPAGLQAGQAKTEPAASPDAAPPAIEAPASSEPKPSGPTPAPTPPTETKTPPATELTPPAASGPQTPSAAEPAPPTATDPTPKGPPAAPSQ